MKKMYMLLMAVLLMVIAGCGGSLPNSKTSGDTSPTSPTAPSSYSLSGTVTGPVVSGVTITLSGAASGTTTTDASGTYSFSGLSNGSYTVTPSSGNTFTPTKRGVLISGASITGQDFTDAVLHDMWIWISGSNTNDQSGTYGTKGVSAASNVPGGRFDAVSWIDSSGNLWLFGGDGFDAGAGHASYDYLNDLWKFDGANWTWISGSDTKRQSGTYGTKGIPAASNVPGARTNAVSWIDGSGNLWLFGGYGYDADGNRGSLNDLWKFDGTNSNWTWISGSNTVGQGGTYGTKGVSDASNVPGARNASVSWSNGSGNLWLFGGGGYDASDNGGSLNDLWKFDTSSGQWTWVSGANTVNQNGTYGTKGVSAAGNVPGARANPASWIDGSGSLWLFGGFGYDATSPFAQNDILNDLWKFDVTTSNWTWVSGSDTKRQSGTYGTKGSPAAGNVPSARWEAASWIDGSGNLWLFGGNDYHSLNDLWKFNVTTSNWTWVSGSNTDDQSGTYGTMGIPAAGNVPGARSSSASWIDSSGNLWLFGGLGGQWLNDLWTYKP